MDSTITNGAWKGQLGLVLAQRELECTLGVAQGMTAKEIAQTLGIAPGTVGKALERAMFKLQVNRRAALIAAAMRQQIITPLCLMLAALIALHSATDEMRRDRKTERRVAVFEVKLARKGCVKSRPSTQVA